MTPKSKNYPRKVHTLKMPAKDKSPKVTLVPIPEARDGGDLYGIPVPKGKNIRVSINLNNRIVFYNSKTLTIYLSHNDMLKTVEQASRFATDRSITLDRTASYEVSLAIMDRLETWHGVMSAMFSAQWYGETGKAVATAFHYYERLEIAKNKQDSVNRDLALMDSKFEYLTKKVQAKLLKKLTEIHNRKPIRK